MIRDCRLKGGAERDVYALLYSLADKSGVAKVSLGYLIERTGYSKRAVIAATNNLIEAGWVMKARASHYGINEYGIVEPASIIGKFDKSKISGAESAPEKPISSAEIAPEQVQKGNLIGAESAPDTPYIYNFYNKTYNNFFIAAEPQEKKEKAVLLEEFFLKSGMYQPMEEVIRFWEYHEQTDWKNAKGQKIVNKKSAVRFWKPESARKMSESAHEILSHLIAVLGEEERICLIAETKSVRSEDNRLVFEFETAAPISLIEDNDEVLAELGKVVRRVCGRETRVEYRI